MTTEINVGEKLTEWVDDFLSKKEGNVPLLVLQVWLNLFNRETRSLPLPEEITREFPFQVARKRADFIGLKISDYALTGILVLLEHEDNLTPGCIVMWLYVLKHLQVTDIDEAVFDVKALRRFTDDGYPNRDQLSELWDKQKVGGANLLDMVNPKTDFLLQLGEVCDGTTAPSPDR